MILHTPLTLIAGILNHKLEQNLKEKNLIKHFKRFGQTIIYINQG
jgi:hypothetical protein